MDKIVGINNQSKILIILHGALGDVIRGLPLVNRIKKSYPTSYITWAVEPLSEPILRDHPTIDKVVLFNRKEGIAGYKKFIKELKSNSYDLVLDLQRHFKSGLTSKLAAQGAKIIGWNKKNTKEFNWLFSDYKIEPVEEPALKINTYQLFGDLLGLERVPSLEFGLNTNKQLKFELPLDKKYVALIVGSSWKSRFWFPEYYAEIIKILSEKYQLHSLIVGATGEAKFAEEILQLVNDQSVVTNLVGKTPLTDLATLFSRVEFAIGSDSGPMHIAAAVGKAVISLWGSTSPKRSAPYGSEHLVLQSALGCSPCYKRECPLKTERLCMKAIRPEGVIAMVESLYLCEDLVRQAKSN